MALSIKNEEAHRLVKELAELTGETQTAALTTAVRERLERLRAVEGARFVDRLMSIARGVGPGIAEPFRSVDHGDMLYDDKGLPR